MVAVDAAITVEIDKLCFVCVSCIEEIEVEKLTFFLGIDYAKCGVDLFAEALDRIDLSLAADRALHVIVIWRVEVFLDHICREGDLTNARRTDLAVRKLGKIKGKISCLHRAVTHNERPKPIFVGINDKVAVGAFVLDVARGSPKTAIIGKAYFDKLNERRRKSVALAQEAVNAADADALVLGFGVIIVYVAVKQRKFIPGREKFVAEYYGVAVRYY